MSNKKGRANRRKALAQAEHILGEIRARNTRVAAIRETTQAIIERATAPFEKELADLMQELSDLDKTLTTLMERERKEIFAKRDRVELIQGVLVYGKDIKISIPRGAAERIVAQGWPVRISVSINRRALESWPDQWLSDIGITKKLVENFSYELLPAKGKGEG